MNKHNIVSNMNSVPVTVFALKISQRF